MILEKFSLAGRRALVVGASRGIGRACALGLAQAGADLALVSRGETVQQAAREIEALGRKALVLREDITAEGAVERVVIRYCGSFRRDRYTFEQRRDHPAGQSREFQR